MSFFCQHKYVPRTGMDSGSVCEKCGSVSNKEISELSDKKISDEWVKPKTNKIPNSIEVTTPKSSRFKF